jgi:hypothetical protein
MDDFTLIGPALIEEAVDWLREHYGEFEFWVERDLVWTVQTHLRQVIGERGLPYLVLNDYHACRIAALAERRPGCARPADRRHGGGGVQVRARAPADRIHGDARQAPGRGLGR